MLEYYLLNLKVKQKTWAPIESLDSKENVYCGTYFE